MGTHNDQNKKITFAGFGADAPYWRRREGDRTAEAKTEAAWKHKTTCIDHECDCWGELTEEDCHWPICTCPKCEACTCPRCVRLGGAHG